MHVAMYPHVCGCISTCMWPSIHVHLAMYQRGHVSTCMWPSIHVRIWLCAMGHSAESGSGLWATAQNFVKRYGPWRRIIDHSAESQQIDWKACHNIKRNSKAKILHLYNALPKAYTIHAWNPSQPIKKIDSALWAITRNDILIWISWLNRSWIRNGFWFMKKTRGQKSRETIPLSC